MESSRQEYWSGLLFSSPGYLPDSGIEPSSPTLQADFFYHLHQGSPYIYNIFGKTTIQLLCLFLTGLFVFLFLSCRVLYILQMHSPYWIYDLQILSPIMGFPGGSDGKESACNTWDLGSIPGLGRSPGEGKGYPLQYSGLENSMDIGSQRVGHEWVTFTWH